MTEPAITLDPEQRALVKDTIADHCRIRGWHHHVAKCRSNHVHVVVTAPECDPKEVRDQLKAWCTRCLKDLERIRRPQVTKIRENWWTEGGSKRVLNTEADLDTAIRYVRECQDRPKEPGHAGSMPTRARRASEGEARPT
jgi:REP element-mobilizing transposase RayT